MDAQQVETVLRAIAASSLPEFGVVERQSAFRVLEEFKAYGGRIPVVLTWLQSSQPITYRDPTTSRQQQGQGQQQQYDVTVATKLLALETLLTFMQKGQYSKISESDRVSLRRAVLKASQVVAMSATTAAAAAGGNGASVADAAGSRILAKKLATVLEGIVVRDFPQRWTTFASEVFAPINEGGLWLPSNNGGDVGPQASPLLGVSICLECLKLVAEDCTDSDFNAKISTQRRNDVLIGLNEVSGVFLPLLYQLLERSYPLLQQHKATLFSMHQYLIQTGRLTSNMSADESAMYKREVRQQRETATLVADTLLTLEKFCSTMPVNWVMGGGSDGNGINSSSNNSNVDFVAAMMHLLRERQAYIQIRAIDCIDMLTLRGKLDFNQWMRLIRELPGAVQEANRVFGAEQEQRTAQQVATSGGQQSAEEPLALQLKFHRALSRMLANVVNTHLSHITTSKRIICQQGPDYESVRSFLRLLVDVLHHPSGRVCIEQVNMWVSLLRDPQVVKTNLLEPFLQEVMTCYMDHLVRLRWEDVENSVHPSYQVLEASFDDEDEYDTWMADLRSRSSLLFKLVGNVDPKIASAVLLARVQSLLTSHGNGQPLNMLEPSNNQLTQKSDAVLAFEGLYHPLDNTLSGIPSWALDPDTSKAPTNDPRRMAIREATRGSLSELAKDLVAWSPTYLWLKFRRASLLETLKFVWKYDPSTLLQGVDSLLRYLGLPDEWKASTSSPSEQGTSRSTEVTSLKKKSGVALVAISKQVSRHLVPWLNELSGATNTLLSSEGLIPMNQMHLFEFLSCVATAVDDPSVRAQFISSVLEGSLEILESAEIQQNISSVSSLLSMFGVTGAQPEYVTNPENVKTVASHYLKLFTAMNRLMSVGRRCNESARKRVVEEASKPSAAYVVPDGGFGAVPAQLNFTEEGPVSIQKLAENDPFVPLWPRILPPLLQIYESTLGIWRPEHQAVLLDNPIQRYVYAISDDEAFLAKTQDGKSGGVFGEGGTAGSVVSGTDRRECNLVPKWSGWLNELRNTCFQMLGLLAAQRALFAPDIAAHYPRLVAVITDPVNLRSMEHRHITQFLKHVVEMLLISCPSTMYPTHLAPLIGPIFEHMRFRLEATWAPVIGSASNPVSAGSTKALKSFDGSEAARLAAQGGDAWFLWYYAHAGLFVGDLDDVTAEAAVEKYRVEIGRAYSDVLQACLALKGDWALVLANQAKEEQAVKRNETSKLAVGPGNRLNEDGVVLNADGTPKLEGQQLIDARKLLRINGICHFLLLENEQIAGNLVLTIIQCLGCPDAYTCRRMTKICHRVLETVAWLPQYSQLLGQHMMMQAIKNLVTEPKWMVGMEWDMINVIRDIYCRLVLGQALQFGGQGAGQQQATATNGSSNQYDQAKTGDRPLQGGGILTTASDYPRLVLASLPGITTSAVSQLEADMKEKRSAKVQKDIIRDLLREAADNLKEMDPGATAGSGGGSTAAAGSLFDRAVEEESLLHNHRRPAAVPDLPEKLVTSSQVAKAMRKQEQEPEGLAASIFNS